MLHEVRGTFECSLGDHSWWRWGGSTCEQLFQSVIKDMEGCGDSRNELRHFGFRWSLSLLDGCVDLRNKVIDSFPQQQLGVFSESEMQVLNRVVDVSEVLFKVVNSLCRELIRRGFPFRKALACKLGELQSAFDRSNHGHGPSWWRVWRR